MVVGSGIMAERLADGNVAIALLANSLATGAGLVALILSFAGISGAHFNPLVTLALAVRGACPWPRVPGYAIAQITGGLAGMVVANLMFDHAAWEISGKIRTGGGQWLSEMVATCGLLLTIHGVSRHQSAWTPFAVACYVTAGYWFTASTCVANPAVAIARAWTDSFSGIRPVDVPPFLLAELAGCLAALAVMRALDPKSAKRQLGKTLATLGAQTPAELALGAPRTTPAELALGAPRTTPAELALGPPRANP
ncbi:MIP family protein [Planctomycetota bacterium]|nr:MIP family protein [Planctomycetota bacterium]